MTLQRNDNIDWRARRLLDNAFNKYFTEEFRSKLDLFSVYVGKEKTCLTEFAGDEFAQFQKKYKN